jgi:hypothetical protein
MRILTQTEIRANNNYKDLADIALIFNHNIVTESHEWQWQPNSLVCYLFHNCPIYAGEISGLLDVDRQKLETSGRMNLNEIWVSYSRDLFSQEELIKFYMLLGTPLSSFVEIFDVPLQGISKKYKGQVLKL